MRVQIMKHVTSRGQCFHTSITQCVSLHMDFGSWWANHKHAQIISSNNISATPEIKNCAYVPCSWLKAERVQLGWQERNEQATKFLLSMLSGTDWVLSEDIFRCCLQKDTQRGKLEPILLVKESLPGCSASFQSQQDDAMMITITLI